MRFRSLCGSSLLRHKNTLYRPNYYHKEIWDNKTALKVLNRRNFFSQALANSEKTINKLTAYEPVEIARELVTKADQEFIAAKSQRSITSKEYSESIDERNKIQQSINGLLHRKQSWSSSELSSFTELCQQEHRAEKLEASLKLKCEAAEQRLEVAHSHYMNALRDHYHEEQIWSEKGRRVSTYVTWGLFLLNTSLFVLSISFVEPMKRQAIVEKVTNNIVRIQAEHTNEILAKHKAELENELMKLKRPSLLDVEQSKEEEAQHVETNTNIVDNKPSLGRVVSFGTAAVLMLCAVCVR